jgi:hypothetical protein
MRVHLDSFTLADMVTQAQANTVPVSPMVLQVPVVSAAPPGSAAPPVSAGAGSTSTPAQPVSAGAVTERA